MGERSGRKRLNNPLAELLRLGAGDEHVGRHPEGATGKERLSQDVLHGMAEGEPLHQIFEFAPIVLR